ncbi:uncharacterized protein LOC129916455 [Episyrphus balteatus]|uniref:uncharacterized protein LOC129916455 n=1 Tax=Episyrphus balteatus TaxID=286459 RepID=UPI0024863C4D|nr:uncharacterized protein LOC129916455 [Episyrphus balteatus]
MEEIFSLCHHFNVIDVNILTEDPKRGVSMFTYFLFTKSICRGFSPILMYNFNEGFEKFNNLFPPKLKNFHGCPIKLSARTFAPYFTFIGNKSKPEPIGNWENISGLEGALMKYLALTLNFTIELLPFAEDQSYGCFELLRNGEADVVIGGFGDSNIVRWGFSPSTAYHNSAIFFVIRGKNMLSSLGRLARPFSIEVWILVAVFFILTIILIFLLKIARKSIYQFVLGEQNHNPVTNFLAVFLGYPMCRTPRRNFARFIFLNMLLLTFILRNAYLGSLYHAFRKDNFFKIPSGFEDLIKWNYTIILPFDNSQLFDFPKERTIIAKMGEFDKRLQFFEELKGRYVTVTLYDQLFYYVLQKLKNKTETGLFTTPEIIYNYHFVMFMRKHSIYLTPFNKMIKELNEAGILEILRSEFVKNDVLFMISRYLKYQKKNIPLNNERLYGLYYLFGSLVGISILVFCLEILSYRFRNLQRIIGWIFKF